jgi:hypothetical protein
MERLLIIVNGSFAPRFGANTTPAESPDLPLPQGFCTLPTDAGCHRKLPDGIGGFGLQSLFVLE